jgi:beta-phosphoglucomutase
LGASLLNANPSHTRFQAIIFDCDGVLVDTEYLKFLAWKEAFDAQGILFSIEEYMPLVGHSSKNILQMIQDAKKIDIPEEIVELKNVKYKNLQKNGVPPIQEVVNFALRLFEYKQQLGIQLALASSARKEEILVNLKQIGLEFAFDLIISGSDDLEAYTDIEGINKPKPYIYIEAAKRLAVSPELCLVFEDTKAGVDAAASAGMATIAVPNQFTLSHDFSRAYHIISSYKEFSSLDILTKLDRKQ